MYFSRSVTRVTGRQRRYSLDGTNYLPIPNPQTGSDCTYADTDGNVADDWGLGYIGGQFVKTYISPDAHSIRMAQSVNGITWNQYDLDGSAGLTLAGISPSSAPPMTPEMGAPAGCLTGNAATDYQCMFIGFYASTTGSFSSDQATWGNAKILVGNFTDSTLTAGTNWAVTSFINTGSAMSTAGIGGAAITTPYEGGPVYYNGLWYWVTGGLGYWKQTGGTPTLPTQYTWQGYFTTTTGTNNPQTLCGADTGGSLYATTPTASGNAWELDCSGGTPGTIYRWTTASANPYTASIWVYGGSVALPTVPGGSNPLGGRVGDPNVMSLLERMAGIAIKGEQLYWNVSNSNQQVPLAGESMFSFDQTGAPYYEGSSGTQYYLATAPAAYSTPYVMASTFVGKPAAGQTLLIHPVTDTPFQLAANCGGSTVVLDGTTATSNMLFPVQSCTSAGVCTTLGSITVYAGSSGTVGSANMAGPCAMSAFTFTRSTGTAYLRVLAPATQDATGANVGISIKANR